MLEESWFFWAHFYYYPVCPGSLGLEALIQLFKIAAVDRWGLEAGEEVVGLVPGEAHEWVYRGQYIPSDDCVTVDGWVTRIDDEHRTLWGDGYLTIDGRVIYHMKSFSVRIEKTR